MKSKNLRPLDYHLLEELSDEQMRILEGGSFLDQIHNAFSKLQHRIQEHPLEAITILGGILLLSIGFSVSKRFENESLKKELKDVKDGMDKLINTKVEEVLKAKFSVFHSPEQQKVAFGSMFSEICDEALQPLTEKAKAIDTKLENHKKDVTGKIFSLREWVKDLEQKQSNQGPEIEEHNERTKHIDKNLDDVAINIIGKISALESEVGILKTDQESMDHEIKGISAWVKNLDCRSMNLVASKEKPFMKATQNPDCGKEDRPSRTMDLSGGGSSEKFTVKTKEFELPPNSYQSKTTKAMDTYKSSAYAPPQSVLDEKKKLQLTANDNQKHTGIESNEIHEEEQASSFGVSSMSNPPPECFKTFQEVNAERPLEEGFLTRAEKLRYRETESGNQEYAEDPEDKLPENKAKKFLEISKNKFHATTRGVKLAYFETSRRLKPNPHEEVIEPVAPYKRFEGTEFYDTPPEEDNNSSLSDKEQRAFDFTEKMIERLYMKDPDLLRYISNIYRERGNLPPLKGNEKKSIMQFILSPLKKSIAKEAVNHGFNLPALTDLDRWKNDTYKKAVNKLNQASKFDLRFSENAFARKADELICNDFVIQNLLNEYQYEKALKKSLGKEEAKKPASKLKGVLLGKGWGEGGTEENVLRRLMDDKYWPHFLKEAKEVFKGKPFPPIHEYHQLAYNFLVLKVHHATVEDLEKYLDHVKNYYKVDNNQPPIYIDYLRMCEAKYGGGPKDQSYDTKEEEEEEGFPGHAQNQMAENCMPLNTNEYKIHDLDAIRGSKTNKHQGTGPNVQAPIISAVTPSNSTSPSAANRIESKFVINDMGSSNSQRIEQVKPKEGLPSYDRTQSGQVGTQGYEDNNQADTNKTIDKPGDHVNKRSSYATLLKNMPGIQNIRGNTTKLN